MQDSLNALEAEAAKPHSSSALATAKHHCEAIVPTMLAVREAVDELETLVADDLWPLPSYQEMLFIK